MQCISPYKLISSNLYLKTIYPCLDIEVLDVGMGLVAGTCACIDELELGAQVCGEIFWKCEGTFGLDVVVAAFFIMAALLVGGQRVELVIYPVGRGRADRKRGVVQVCVGEGGG